MRVMSKRCCLTAAVALILPALGQAQTAPDAGQTLQQELRQRPQPLPSGPALELPTVGETALPAGGPQITLRGITIEGATVFTEAQLSALLQDAIGKNHDLASLQKLAQRLTAHYRQAGYPLARAIVPAQKATDGIVRFLIVEGRFGKVAAVGDATLSEPAKAFLAPLKEQIVATAPLERATLILSDQPGIRTAPLLRPGDELGTSDLEVRVEPTERLTGDIGLDNHGNRYSGQYRARANVQGNRLLTFGDQLVARFLYSDENLWLGSLGYNLPLGTSGLRGNIGYAHTSYELGKDFANLGATGTADVSTLGLSYPIIRSRQTNLSLAATLQHKKLNDKQRVAGTDADKSSISLPIALTFDHRDGLGGGAINYGSLTYTPGRHKLDSALEAADRASGQNTRGHFAKWNFDIARLQATPLPNLTLFGRFSGQWANKNLDSSESFTLGGASGVRAYPQGEGTGDEGWLVQLEGRWRMGSIEPFVFYDAGRVRINAKPDALVPPVANNTRSIAGAGLGLRYGDGPFNLEAVLAWRTQGGKPQSDTKDDHPRLWVTAGYRF